MILGTIAVLLPSCGDKGLKPEISANEHQLIELEHRLKLLGFRAGRADSGSFGELRTLEETLASAAGRIRGMVATRIWRNSSPRPRPG